ncbi:hypothetical protein Ahy_B01g055970 isoform D [Arachis hypogaea]|uniref:Uncharacterized protein n=1 Tax=Arachis hypogaea TaxID=3818 RepID=A0A445AXP4_ARAHY|nr:hypothetical protein Ahy_B01g055970 isoform D [Arachis hypogaea]
MASFALIEGIEWVDEKCGGPVNMKEHRSGTASPSHLIPLGTQFPFSHLLPLLFRHPTKEIPTYHPSLLLLLYFISDNARICRS